jgi:hypothetical protein
MKYTRIGWSPAGKTPNFYISFGTFLGMGRLSLISLREYFFKNFLAGMTQVYGRNLPETSVNAG